MYKDDEDKLIFDRKLAYGSGSSMYGLDMQNLFIWIENFLSMANEIRKRLTDDYSSIERLTQRKKHQNIITMFLHLHVLFVDELVMMYII